MSIVIYLANSEIQIVEGSAGERISIERQLSRKTPEGSIVNGVVTDPDAFALFLKNVFDEKKIPKSDVSLVINSSKFVGQIMTLPPLSPKHTLEYIHREYANIEKEENKLYGFLRLKEKKGEGPGRIYAESISPDYIGGYVSLFEKAGIKLKGIYSGETSLIAAASATSGDSKESFLLVAAESMTFTTVLFIDGVFTYYNSLRCFKEKGSEGYAGELARTVSQIKQFMQANQLGDNIEKVLLAGVDPADLEMYKDAIAGLGITTNVKMFSGSGRTKGKLSDRAGDLIFAASGLFAAGDSSNYLLAYKKSIKPAGKNENLIFVSIGAAVTVFMAALLIIALVVENGKKDKIAELKAQNEQMAFVSADHDEVAGQNAALAENSYRLEDMTENLAGYPWLSAGLAEKIMKLSEKADVRISGYDAGSGALSINVQADQPGDINEFAGKLKGIEGQKRIDYSGYNLTSAGKYSAEIKLILAEGSGRAKS